MIKVKVYNVDTVDCDVTSNTTTFEDYDEMFDYIIGMWGEEDVNGTNIREEQYGENEIVVELDVYFVKYEILD